MSDNQEVKASRKTAVELRGKAGGQQRREVLRVTKSDS
uniref:Uncharacterized protein n=1 Tax=Setaria italica TaxID=4555 RepID=K3ZFP2_SETIT